MCLKNNDNFKWVSSQHNQDHFVNGKLYISANDNNCKLWYVDDDNIKENLQTLSRWNAMYHIIGTLTSIDLIINAISVFFSRTYFFHF
jgi:hypothetical protein